MARGIDVRALPGRLEHPELRLQLNGVAPERLERVLDALLVVALLGDGEIFNAWKRGDRGLCALFLCHGFLSRSPQDAETC
jgi:hypothetical protein